MRICLVYDCLFPYTVGGAERWYRNLAARLAADGPRRHLSDPAPVDRRRAAGRARACGSSASRRGGALYADDGAGASCPPLRFGARRARASAAPRARLRRRAHAPRSRTSRCSAAGRPRRPADARLVVDWHEVWTRGVLARVPRRGRRAHRARRPARCCARVPQRAFCFSDLHARRLRAEGLRAEPVTPRGPLRRRRSTPPGPTRRRPLVVFAGRHIREKRPAPSRRRSPTRAAALPELRGLDPRRRPRARPRCSPRSRASASTDVVDAPGFVDPDEVDAALRPRTLPAAALGARGLRARRHRGRRDRAPSVVVRGADNAAVELVEEGVNGFVVAAGRRSALADAIVRVRTPAARSCASRPRAWFDAHARAAVASSTPLRTVAERYARQRPLVAREHAARGALPRERRGPLAARAARGGHARRDRPAGARIASAIARGLSGSKSSAASPATSGERERSEQATGTPRAIASSTGSPKPSYSEGNTKQRGQRIQGLELGRRHPARNRVSPATPSARGALAQLALVRRGIARAARAPAGARAGSGRAPRAAGRRFLCGRLADTLSAHRPVARARGARAGRPRASARRGRAPRPQRHDVDLPGRDPQVRDEVVAGRSRRRRSRGASGARPRGTSTRMPERPQRRSAPPARAGN